MEMPSIPENNLEIEPSDLKVFDFDPEKYKEDFQRNGYVHVRNGLNTNFFGYISKQIAKIKEQRSKELSDWNIPNKKTQYLFDFPSQESLQVLLDGIAIISGKNRDGMTISERHIKFYAPNAPSHPLPHKDRLASEVAVGIPIDVPEHSRLVLYPHFSKTINPFNKSITLKDGFDDAPNELLLDNKSVVLNAKPQDVVVFWGSSQYHERLYGAGAVVLYLKFNSMGIDPLEEDPTTLQQREKSLLLLVTKSNDQLLESSIILSPRFQEIKRHYTRLNWQQVLKITISKDQEFIISEDEMNILLNLSSIKSIKALFRELQISQNDFLANLNKMKRLVSVGAIDILS